MKHFEKAVRSNKIPEGDLSFNWLRYELEAGFRELLEAIPKGEEPVLKQYVANSPGCSGSQQSAARDQTPLHLLYNFADFVENLERTQRTMAEIREIMEKESGAQLVFFENPDPLLQKYTD